MQSDPFVTSVRLIPAHAGKTCARASPGADPGAHPRSRGENIARERSAAHERGSSPLTRGKLHVGHLLTLYLGLIPAHAGKTSMLSRATTRATAHPRSRGENGTRSIVYTLRMGSSPLTRGKPRASRPRARRSGLIPAHAGKTSARVTRGRAPRAHPRSRGENTTPSLTNLALTGSSPLTRGKLLSELVERFK